MTADLKVYDIMVCFHMGLTSLADSQVLRGVSWQGVDLTGESGCGESRLFMERVRRRLPVFVMWPSENWK
jgi:hypothetical protein